MRTSPPPPSPLASISAPASAICVPVMSMRPPVGRGCGRSELATASLLIRGARVETRPVTRTAPPPPPPSTTAPLRTETERASATPERLMALRAALRAVAAFISISPPSAETRP